MNEISFVIALDDFGAGEKDGLEPVIDGISLVDILKWADGEIAHAGLSEIDRALGHLRDIPGAGSETSVQVLGCTCGIDDCSGVTALVSAGGGAIRWSEIRANLAPAGPPGSRTYAEVGPFVFVAEQYAAAVASPVRAERPTREAADIEQLAAGGPSDHAAWLRAMTMAFGRDFITPGQPDLTREVAARGLRAFAQAGAPVTEQAVREWARGRRFSDDAIEQYVTWFHELNPRSQKS